MKKVVFNSTAMTIQFSEIPSDYLLALSNTTAREYLLSQGITKEEIRALERFGFRAADIKPVYEAIKTEDDKKLITGLLKGDYEAAFHANSKNITVPTQMFLSEFLLRVSMSPNSDAKLQEIMNVILKPEADTRYPVAGNLGSNSNTFSYIEMLYAGTTNILELESVLLYAPEDLQEERYKELVERNGRLMSLATLYGSQYEILSQALGVGDLYKNYIPDLSNISISNLKSKENSQFYSYDISYSGKQRYFSFAGESGSIKVEKQLSVDTQLLNDPSKVARQIQYEAYKKLQQEKGKLGNQLISDILEGGGTAYLTSLNPMLGAGVGLLSGLAKGSIGDTYKAGVKGIKAGSLMDNTTVKKVFSNENIAIPGKVLSAVQKYYNNMDKINSELSEKEYEIELSAFGEGGTYTVDGENRRMVVSGTYNPEVIARIGAWEEGGIEGLIERSGADCAALTGEQKKQLKDSLTPDEKKIWFGDGILEMSRDSLIDAVTGFEDKYYQKTGHRINVLGLLETGGEQ